LIEKTLDNKVIDTNVEDGVHHTCGGYHGCEKGCNLGISTAAPDLTESKRGWRVLGDESVNEKDFPVVFSSLEIEDFKESFRCVDMAWFPSKKSWHVSDVIINPGGTLIPNL
jgi:hypothetical protein